MIVQRRTVLVPEEYAGRRGADTERRRCGGRDLHLRRLGEESPNHRWLGQRCVRRHIPHRQHQPVPIQGLLLRRRDRLVLSERQILRPQRRQVYKR